MNIENTYEQEIKKSMTITKEELDLINGLTREQLIYVLIDY